jgi:hypothetical protein
VRRCFLFPKNSICLHASQCCRTNGWPRLHESIVRGATRTMVSLTSFSLTCLWSELQVIHRLSQSRLITRDRWFAVEAPIAQNRWFALEAAIALHTVSCSAHCWTVLLPVHRRAKCLHPSPGFAAACAVDLAFSHMVQSISTCATLMARSAATSFGQLRHPKPFGRLGHCWRLR